MLFLLAVPNFYCSINKNMVAVSIYSCLQRKINLVDENDVESFIGYKIMLMELLRILRKNECSLVSEIMCRLYWYSIIFHGLENVVDFSLENFCNNIWGL